MALFGNRVIADIISEDEVIYWKWGGALIQYDWYPHKRKKFRQRQTCTRENNVKTHRENTV